MNKKSILILISVLLLFILIGSAKMFFMNEKDDLVYLVKDSYLNDFYFEDEYVILDCDIKIKNTTSKDHYFYMDADILSDIGLTKERIANGYQKATDEKIFFIEKNTEKSFQVDFKSLKGDKFEKTNRLPPESLIIKKRY